MAKQDDARDARPDLLGNAVFANSFRMLSRSSDSTGYRTAALRYQTSSLSSAPRTAEEFLVNTRLIRNDPESESSILAYFSDSTATLLSMLDTDAHDGASTHHFVDSLPLRTEFSEVVGRRRSCRTFTGDTIDASYLGTLLHNAAGITGEANVQVAEAETVRLSFRATPSGGGLYPIELFVGVQRVASMTRGVSRFSPRDNALVHYGEAEMLDRLVGCFSVPDEVLSISRANVVIMLVGHAWRSMRRYGPRGLRLAFLEAGAIAAQLNLTATALGLGSVDCASIFDDEVHDALALDGIYRTLMHCVVIGVPG